MPDIVVEHCLFDSLDCRHIWDVRKTKAEFQKPNLSFAAGNLLANHKQKLVKIHLKAW